MTRLEFEQTLKTMTDLHNYPECPDEIKEKSWAECKDYSVGEFKHHLEKYFEYANNKYKEPDSKEFIEEVKQYKKEVHNLLGRLLKSEAGHVVLKDIGEHLGLEIGIANSSEIEVKDLEGYTEIKLNDEDEKCPDKITPDILKILKGDKDD